MSSSSVGSSARSSTSSNVNSFDVEELVQIGARCQELRKEKDMLKESQSESFGLIKALELHAKSLSQIRLEDKKKIQKLEKDLLNCYQEIDYLQDQLNARNDEVNFLTDHVHNLEVKLAETENLGVEVSHLREELLRSKSECFMMVRELDNKEIELQTSTRTVEKLEETVSLLNLETQCEIESMKLDIFTLEQALCDAKNIEEENVQEKCRLSGKVEELQVQLQEAQERAKNLDEENKKLRETQDTSELTVKAFCQEVQRRLNKDGAIFLNPASFLSELRNNLPASQEAIEAFDAIFSKLAVQLSPSEDSSEKAKRLSEEIHEYEQLVKKLKEELRKEKSKAKEEAEDLAQEMAELRYKMTCLLEDECKRRACVEQASLLRISELEAQIKKEKGKSFTRILPLPEG